jgi:hypothetical protein
MAMRQAQAAVLCRTTLQIAQTASAQVGEIEAGKGDRQAVRRRRIQWEKPSLGSPHANLTAHLRKQQLSPGTRRSKATESTVIATGNLRQGRM